MDAIERVPVPTETAAPWDATNAYVVGSRGAVLVDPAGRTDALDAAAADREVDRVAVTHAHDDHVGGVEHYATERDATVLARAGREGRFRAATGVAPDETVRVGSVLRAGDAGVTALSTPGHAPDHVAFVVRAGGETAVLCGDLAVAEGSVVVGAPEGDLRGYLTALRRLRALGADALYPGHGPVVDDPEATLRRLIDHRLARERRVLAAVRDGSRTPDDVVDAAYDKDVSAVRDLARRTVVAHLEKLAVEGGVSWDGETARPA